MLAYSRGGYASFPFAGIVGRAYWEASQIKLRRNRMLIRAARTTNMLLHSALQLLQARELTSRKEAADLDGVRKQAAILRLEFDGERAKSIALQLQACKIHDRTNSDNINFLALEDKDAQ